MILRNLKKTKIVKIAQLLRCDDTEIYRACNTHIHVHVAIRVSYRIFGLGGGIY